MEASIRQLAPVEMNLIHDLALRIWPESFKHILEQDQIDYMLDWMYDVNTLQEQALTGHLFYMISLNGENVGFLGLEPNYPEADKLRIHKIYVDPKIHKQGLGRKLFDKTIEVARDLEMKSIHLNVNRFNDAVGFYKYLGFETIGEEDLKIGKGYLMEDFIMEYTIN